MKLTANRVVLLLHSAFIVATAAGIFLAAINNSLPHAWQASVAAAITIITAVAGGTTAVIKFLDGSQKFDQLTAHSADVQTLRSSPPVGNVGWQTHVADDSSATETYVDRDLTQWAGAEPTQADLETGPDEPLEPENLNSDEWLKARAPAPVEDAEPEVQS